MKKIAFSAVLILLAFAAIAQDSKQTFNRKVLVEQFTTAQCGWCPLGAEHLGEAIGNSTSYIWIKYHAGFYTDDLTNDIHESMLWFYGGSTFAPAVMIDRTRMDDSRPGPVFGIGSANVMGPKLQQAKNVETYCKIYTPEITFNPETRTISGTISGRFGDQVYNENTRLVVSLIEDSIFMQQHDYENGSSSNGYAVDYWHMGTVRATLTDMWGDTFSVNEDDNMSFSFPINYTLPESYVSKNCRIVAFIYNYDPTDYNNCQVMNAAQSDFLTNVLSIGETEANTQLRLFPNPATNRVVLESDALISQVSLINTLGQVVMHQAGNGASMQLNLDNLNAGLYIVRIQTANGVATRQLVIQ